MLHFALEFNTVLAYPVTSLCDCVQWSLAPRFAPGLVGVGSGVPQLGPGAPGISGEADRSLATAFERVGRGTSGTTSPTELVYL